MRNKSVSIAAAILAGGKNSRMKGQNKAFLKINGLSLIESTLKLLKATFKEIILVTNYPRAFKAYAKEVIIAEDLIKDTGPLGGIHSALAVTSKQVVFFMACDMPNLHNALILRLINYFKRTNFDVVLPRINSSVEPLYGIYRKGLQEKLDIFLHTSKNYSIRNFLRTVKVGYLDLEDNSLNRKTFANLNTPKDLSDLTEGIWK